MKKYVYQLVARGTLLTFDSLSEIRSGTVFTSQENANRRIDKFKALVTDSSKLNALADNELLKITVQPLEIVED